jgi:hypothetical protein
MPARPQPEAPTPAPPASPLRLLGVDFTCAPSRRKPIVVAEGLLQGAAVRLQGLRELPTLAAFEALLAEPGPWLGAFDLPFGLPRGFVQALDLGGDCAAVAAAVRARCPRRMDFRALVDAFGQDRPAGQRLLHRATDTALGEGLRSTSPLQTRYVPVGFMWFEGLPRLLAAGCALPGLHAGDDARRAVEGYPGLLAHELLGRRSYKNAGSAEADAARLIARKDALEALEQGRSRLGLRLRLSHAQRDALAADAGGDRLDAVLCLMQAGWAAQQPGAGMPDGADPVEGWIASAPGAVSSLAPGAAPGRGPRWT